MDLQLFIVIIIGIITGIIVLRQIWHFFTRKESSHCGGCNLCELGPKKEAEETLSRTH